MVNAGGFTSRVPTCGSVRAADAEVRAPEEYIPGGTSSGVDAVVTDRAGLMDMFITTASGRVTGVEATAVGMDYRTDIKARMGVRTGVKGTLPTPPNP